MTLTIHDTGRCGECAHTFREHVPDGCACGCMRTFAYVEGAPIPGTVVEGRGLTRVERILTEGYYGLEAGILFGLDPSQAHLVTMARRDYAALRHAVGYRFASADVLTSGAAQHKLAKNAMPTAGLMLTPERGMMSPAVADIRQAFGLSGPINLCPRASKGCAAACLVFSGQSGMPAAQRAQAVRTAFLLSHPFAFGLLLGAEIARALRKGKGLALRLNTTSDIRWEMVAPRAIERMRALGVVLYDYTAWAPEDRGAGVHLTYSAKEPGHTPDEYLGEILDSGHNVAMPFATRGDLPELWNGHRVIDGDLTDFRPDDDRGVVVGLRVKGHKGMKDETGFIRPIA